MTLRKRLENFFFDYFSFRVPLDNRICYIMCICGIIGNTFSLISNISMGLPLAVNIITALSLCAMFVLTFIAFHLKKTEKISIIVTILISNVVFPLIFITGGGIKSGMVFFLLLVSVCYAYIFHGKMMYVCVLFTLAEYIALLWLSFHKPSLIYFLPEKAVLGDMITGLTVTFSFIMFFSMLCAKQYRYDHNCLKRLSDLYEHQAITDENTGLFNRRYFKTLLDIAIPTASEENPVSLAMFDIDDFKKINDTYGHLFGDEILKRFGSILQEESQNGIISCRYGGEEFLLLFPKIPHNEALAITERVLEKTRSTILCGEAKKPVTVSAGFATCTSDMTYDTIMQTVDGFLYQAKFSGKNRVVTAK